MVLKSQTLSDFPLTDRRVLLFRGCDWWLVRSLLSSVLMAAPGWKTEPRPVRFCCYLQQFRKNAHALSQSIKLANKQFSKRNKTFFPTTSPCSNFTTAPPPNQTTLTQYNISMTVVVLHHFFSSCKASLSPATDWTLAIFL